MKYLNSSLCDMQIMQIMTSYCILDLESSQNIPHSLKAPWLIVSLDNVVWSFELYVGLSTCLQYF